MAGPDDVHRSSTLLPGERLGLGLDDRSDDFARLLLAPPLDGIRPAGHDWLRERYAEIVPVVLPAALHAVEHGTPVASEALSALRALAADRATDPRVDVAVALRGAVPALRVFTLVMRTATQEHPGRAMLAMGRASLVAHELGTCWFEAWAQQRRRTPGIDDTDTDVELVAAVPGLDETEEQMLALAAQGLSNDAIAKETAYSRQAVAWHLGRLMRACGAPNRTALVSVAFVRGWLRSRSGRHGDTP
ncbi:helix-turn-helix transcriptional regulator [Microbacterium sp. M1A1_1b]